MTEPVDTRSKHAWQAAAGASGCIAVIAGAMAAHAVADSTLQTLAETASYWQLIHAGVLLWLSTAGGGWLRVARWLMLAGTVLFCGTIYLKAFGLAPGATALAPTGGICFILAWLAIAIGSVHRLIRRG